MRRLGNVRTSLLWGLLLAILVAVGPLCDAVHGQVLLQKISSGKKAPEPVAEREPRQHRIATDAYARDTPRTSVKGYFRAARDGDYERASLYMDFREFPAATTQKEKGILAHKFKVVLDRTLWVDLDALSIQPEGRLDDGLPADGEFVGSIQAAGRVVDITLQRIPINETDAIWQFSSTTVGQIPDLYKQFGYGPLGEWLEVNLPAWDLLGMPFWQWVLVLIFAAISYLVALVVTWIASKWIQRSESGVMRQVGRLVTGPVRFLIMLFILRHLASLLPLSAMVRKLMEVRTISTVMLVWAGFLLVNILVEVSGERLQKSGSGAAKVLLPPIRAGSKILIVLIACVVWLENIGFEVSTLLAGLGVGGIAVALAAQDTLKNFLGSIMIMLDKPYTVGQRINVKGHDGTVEEIGIRSTKIRLLSGRQVTIPNEEMAKIDVENVARRGFIKRVSNLEIAYDTPPEKVEGALEILRGVLENHEGFDAKRPPRVYFTEFNPGSLNLRIIYWYHPAKVWSFYAFSEKVNLRILREFAAEGIQFAFPTSTTYLAQRDGKSLRLALVGEAEAAAGPEQALAELPEESES